MAPLKFKRALRSAARLPGRVAGSRSSSGRSGTNVFAPQPNELPLVLLRIQVLGCTALAAKDRNGHSDPFVVVSVLNTRHQTPVAKRNVNPTYVPKDSTWDFPLYLSLADKLGAVELVVWDKDMVGKDYLGEVAIPLDEWWGDEGRSFGWDDPANKAFTVNLQSTRAGTAASGAVHVKMGFVKPSQSQTQLEFDEIFAELVKRSRPSLVSAPPTEGVGTIRSSTGGPQLEDDGGLSSDDPDSESEDEYVDAPESSSSSTQASPLLDIYTPPKKASESAPQPPLLTVQPSSPIHDPDSKTPTASIAGVLTPTQGSTPTPTSTPSTATATTPAGPPPGTIKPPSSPSFAKKMFPIPIPLPRRLSGLSSSSSSSSSGSLGTPSPAVPPPNPVIDPVSGNLVPGTPASAPEDAGLSPLPSPGPEGKKGRLFRKGWGTPSNSAPPTPSAEVGEPALSVPAIEGKKGKGSRAREGKAYSLDAQNDILGIVMLEVLKAEDLPKLKNMTRTGWDMDPFVVVSFGKKVFRTRVIRHSLNPTFEEKLLFHVRRYETSFSVQLAVHDWDKLSSNDHIGDANFEVRELIEKAPQKNPETGLYAGEEDGEHDMVEFKLKLDAGKEAGSIWESKHTPLIYVRAKYQPYDLLRQRFWRQYLKQYDTDDTGKISHLELTSMLDSLGSTLTRDTLNAFFTTHGKQPHLDELTIGEVIQSLETELGRPDAEKRRVDEEGVDTSLVQTPAVGVEGGGEGGEGGGKKLDLSEMDFSGPGHVRGEEAYVTQGMEVPLEVVADGGAGNGTGVPPPVMGGTPGSYSSASYSSDDAEVDENGVGAGGVLAPPVAHAGGAAGALKVKKTRFRRKAKSEGAGKTKEASSGSSGSGVGVDDTIERVINVKNCPLCHRPRLTDRAEVDIITHLAICASQDWNKVDRIVVGNFVTASQAQRKWYTKIITKVSSGDYRLGANSANIIVQNRMTGQLEEEKMQVYVRLGIRLLYKGATSRMEGGRARRLLKSLSVKQGIKYDAPQSALDIPTFIAFHGLNMNEILDPLDSFKTFNQFFYRKLKPTARPIEQPDNPYRLVSAADCRLMCFASVEEATRLWIKGREFTVGRLLGDTYKDQAERYNGGALAIFRLAPQDYHRFHSPVEGRIGPMTVISGEYYTVNPQAIRSSLDVYGENVRKIVPIDSPHFGRVMAVCIGAMMVGSIKTTVNEGDYVQRGQEFGYFAFGGSTIVVLFEKDRVEWDEDLLINGRAALETLVRVGMGIGNGRRPAE
ncbi:phosphatidylserine decarboxylase-domain-containing protein [Lyophyllum atratum]|nr:phosphatidylserine decarboxylase-domain-containing protein [Lyophyllum atratum]